VQVADNFLYRAFETGKGCVLWIIEVDPRGAKELVYRCKQARVLLICSERHSACMHFNCLVNKMTRRYQ
jgi:hypothetical protein